MDPNPIESVNDLGHNYFLSKNPYKLISYAVFGEAYYNIADNLKLTAGLRWTVDKKESPRIPSMLLASNSVGHPVLAVEDQEWREPTGRLALDWKPDLSFTDDTLLYASYSHGYKAGGSNPPPSGIVTWTPNLGPGKVAETVAKPKTFEPEFVNAFEVGAKNTLLDGRMTLNLAGFYYDYKGYQVSQIIDRSAVNYNFDAKVWGLELEADWRPLENLRFGFKGGYENTRIADGEKAIDIMERNYGHGPDSADPWVVIRPFPTYPSNCVLPLSIFDQGPGSTYTNLRYPLFTSGHEGPCEIAYSLDLDPVTFLPYVPNPTQTLGIFGDIIPLATAPWYQRYIDYPGFNPLDESQGHNHGEGFFKPLGGHELPNAPHFTATVTADYTIPLPNDWLATLHTDLYYQSEAWTRVFNMEGYDKLKAFTNVNVAAIFTNDDAGWKVMAYVKNVFDKDNITGAFLNSDDTGLTTNVFLVEPRLYGLRVTKDFSGGPWWTGASPDHVGPYPLTVELSGSAIQQDAPYQPVLTPLARQFSAAISPASVQNRDLDWGDGREIKLTYQPGGAWSVSGSYRYGRSNKDTPLVHADEPSGPPACGIPSSSPYAFLCEAFAQYVVRAGTNWSDSTDREREAHEIADFTVGRDVGLGLIGDSHSTLSAGLRYASFSSTTAATMSGVSDIFYADGWAKYGTPHHRFEASLKADREFKGAGPVLTWAAAQRLFGSEQVGHLDVDWSLTSGVLFGRQKTQVGGDYASVYLDQPPTNRLPPLTEHPIGIEPRSKDVTVPMLDLSLGLAYEVQRIKVGAGYKWERYFNVLDAGYDEHKDADRTIDGPYFKIAVGFGG
jgi:outer membrane receptor protein involved in Fe transport